MVNDADMSRKVHRLGRTLSLSVKITTDHNVKEVAVLYNGFS